MADPFAQQFDVAQIIQRHLRAHQFRRDHRHQSILFHWRGRILRTIVEDDETALAHGEVTATSAFVVAQHQQETVGLTELGEVTFTNRCWSWQWRCVGRETGSEELAALGCSTTRWRRWWKECIVVVQGWDNGWSAASRSTGQILGIEYGSWSIGTGWGWWRMAGAWRGKRGDGERWLHGEVDDWIGICVGIDMDGRIYILLS